MSVTKEEVLKIAQLARLLVDDEEIEALTKQFNSILDYMDQLNEVDTTAVEPLFHPLDLNNVMRADNIEESLPVEKVLSNAPARSGNYFKVPKVITK